MSICLTPILTECCRTGCNNSQSVSLVIPGLWATPTSRYVDGTGGACQIYVERTRFIARIDGSISALITCVHPVGREACRLLAQPTKDLSRSIGPRTFVGCNPDEE